jgi:RHS repeat-associated protein
LRENGAITDRKDFAAFGDETTASRTSGLGYTSAHEPRQDYTGYEKDSESGLEFAQARYYNTTHGRFTSVDPLMASANPANPQTFNRYSYVMNQPTHMVDPSGLEACEESDIANCSGFDDEEWGAPAPRSERRGHARYESILNNSYDPETNRYTGTVTFYVYAGSNASGSWFRPVTLNQPTLDEAIATEDSLRKEAYDTLQSEINARRRTQIRADLASPGAASINAAITRIRDTNHEGVFAQANGDGTALLSALAANGFYEGNDIGYHRKELGCGKNDCIGYRSEMGSMGIKGSMQIVYNTTSGLLYIDHDRFNPRQDVRGALGHFFIEILGTGGYGSRSALVDRASQSRTNYNR